MITTSRFLDPICISLLLCLCFSTLVGAHRPRNSFQHWFPDVKAELSAIVANQCHNEFQEYLDERIVQYGVHCVKTFNCIVYNCTEYTKANMASAAVLLGLTPTILAALGSSTSELSRLSSRRPFLALLMVLGSPATNPIRTFDYHSPTKDLEISPEEKEIPDFSDKADRLLALFQLLLGLGSVINLGLLCATINFYSVSVMSCDYSDILVEMWVGAALVTHLFGVITFLARAKTSYSGIVSSSQWWKNWYRNECRTCIKHTEHKLYWGPENTAFIIASWVTSVFTIIHLAYGTLQFSSMFFVGTPDTVQIVGRFMLSTVVCRAIVAYELAGQKIAAKKHEWNERDQRLAGAEGHPANTLHHLLPMQTRKSPRSSIRGLASIDDDVAEGNVPIPLRVVNPGSLELEGNERRTTSRLRRASTSSNVGAATDNAFLNLRRSRTEEV